MAKYHAQCIKRKENSGKGQNFKRNDPLLSKFGFDMFRGKTGKPATAWEYTLNWWGTPQHATNDIVKVNQSNIPKFREATGAENVPLHNRHTKMPPTKRDAKLKRREQLASVDGSWRQNCRTKKQYNSKTRCLLSILQVTKSWASAPRQVQVIQQQSVDVDVTDTVAAPSVHFLNLHSARNMGTRKSGQKYRRGHRLSGAKGN